MKNKDLSFPEIESGRGRVGMIGDVKNEDDASRKFKLKLSEMNVSVNKRAPLN